MPIEQLKIKYASPANTVPPQPIRLEVGGWSGPAQKMVDGSEPQPWHCRPFVEASTYGLELIYPHETECQVVNDNGDIRFDFDYAQDPSGELTGGEFITFFPKEASKYYLFNTRHDIQPPPGYVVRTEPHPRFFTDDTGTVPLAIIGHVQNEWWPRRLFVVFKVPPSGQRQIFRKGEAYAQLIFVPQQARYELTAMSDDEVTRRQTLESGIASAKLEIAENVWRNPSGYEFNDHYKVLARAFAREGLEGVETVVRQAVERQRMALPHDKPVAEGLAMAQQCLDAGKFDEAQVIYRHVLERHHDHPAALSGLGIALACRGAANSGIKLMERAVAIEPNAPAYHSNLAEMLRLLGRLAEAEAHFRTSLQLYPHEPGVLSALGLTMAQQGRLVEGLKACRTAVAMDPRQPPTHLRLGMVLAQMGQYTEARAAYEAALALAPGFPQAAEALRGLPGEPGN